MLKMYKLVDDNGMSIHTFIVLARSQEEAFKKCNGLGFKYSYRDCKQIAGDVFVMFQDSFPMA